MMNDALSPTFEVGTYLDNNQLDKLFHNHRETRRTWVRKYGFPLPIKFGQKALWKTQEVLDWMKLNAKSL